MTTSRLTKFFNREAKRMSGLDEAGWKEFRAKMKRIRTRREKLLASAKAKLTAEEWKAIEDYYGDW